MNITKFDKLKYGIEGTGINTVTTKERVWKNKKTGEVSFTIPVGSKVHVDFSPKMFSGSIFITIGDQVQVSKISHASNWLNGFKKCPTLKTLEKWSWDGVAKTVTGHKTEPDGYGPDGSPSWLLVVGII